MNQSVAAKTQDLVHRRNAPLATPTDLKAAATKDIAGAMNAILADVFALYLKTKNFHWHMSGPHFRDYHLLLDEQADRIFAMAAHAPASQGHAASRVPAATGGTEIATTLAKERRGISIDFVRNFFMEAPFCALASACIPPAGKRSRHLQLIRSTESGTSPSGTIRGG